MRQVLLLDLLLLTCFAYSQSLNKQSLELTAQMRREKQGHYLTQLGTVSYQNAWRRGSRMVEMTNFTTAATISSMHEPGPSLRSG